MEMHYPQLSANNLQILLIEKKAKEMGVPASEIEAEWVENFSPIFRKLWDKGERDIDAFEDKVYALELGSNYADMIHLIITQ